MRRRSGGPLLRIRRRLANGAVRAVLGSRAHPLLDRWLLLLTYRGRRTGRSYTIPLLYVAEGDDLLLVALHPSGQSWWRNLRNGADVELLVAGRRLRGRASVDEDGPAARRSYAARRPWTAPVLRHSRDAVFVRVTPRESGPSTPPPARAPSRPRG